MKIFITWSGQHSHKVALALREWLPDVIHGIEIFVSSEDIRKGKRWRQEISSELEASNFGIACLTPDNLEQPWLLFESGALSKTVKEGALYTMLFGGLQISAVKDPLGQFHHTVFEKDDVLKLLIEINKHHTPQLALDRLTKQFERCWPDLETAISGAMKHAPQPEQSRSMEDMMQEVLETVTQIAKNTPTNRPVRRLKYYPPPPSRPEGTEDEQWAKIVQAVNLKAPGLRSLLEQATARFTDKQLEIVLPEEFAEQVQALNDANGIQLMQTVLVELGYRLREVFFVTE